MADCLLDVADEREWPQMTLYTKYVCFWCCGRRPQLGFDGVEHLTDARSTLDSLKQKLGLVAGAVKIMLWTELIFLS